MDFWENPQIGRVEKRVGGWLGDFKTFILRGNVVDLAVGIMIGAAFSNVVQSLVGDIFTPLIPGGNTSLAGLAFRVPYTGGTLKLGAFINVVIAFLLLALIIYFFVVKPINALEERFKPKKAEAPTTRQCPFCLSTVPLQATRCAYCTAQLPPPEQAAPPRT